MNIRAWFNRTFRKAEMEAKLVSLSIRDGKVDVVFKHPEASALLARFMVDLFQANKGINYVEMTVLDQITMEPYTITIRKTFRPTPQEINQMMRDALKSIASSPIETSAVWMQNTAHDALERCGY